MKLISFGIAKDIIGTKEMEIDHSKIGTVGQLRAFLDDQYSGFTQIKGYMVAVNESYAEDKKRLSDQDVIAIIPPVSGG